MTEGNKGVKTLRQKLRWVKNYWERNQCPPPCTKQLQSWRDHTALQLPTLVKDKLRKMET